MQESEAYDVTPECVMSHCIRAEGDAGERRLVRGDEGRASDVEELGAHVTLLQPAAGDDARARVRAERAEPARAHEQAD